MRNPLLFLAFILLSSPALSLAAESPALMLENDVLSLALSPDTAAISVTDKRTGFVWRQTAQPDFRVNVDAAADKAAVAGPNAISARVIGPKEEYEITIALGGGQSPNAFNLSVSIPGKRYGYLPDYPFPFETPGPDWQYVQNTTGEGVLMPLANPEAISKLYGWAGSQPWWGMTDLKQAMMARIDTFRLPDTRTGKDSTVYALPMKICYSFYTDGGYVGLAKAYRHYFLEQYPDLQTQEEKIAERPGISFLKDAVYIYFWDDDWHTTAQLIQEMKAAGMERVIATFYKRTSADRISPEIYAAIDNQGWLGGLYKMPTGNLSTASSINRWNIKALVGEVSEEDLAASGTGRWYRTCGKYIAEHWQEMLDEENGVYHNKLYYYDTLTVQLAPCPDPEHPSTVEENMEARKDILRQTQDRGIVVGSGEGVNPMWSAPYLDFFEGAMSLRTYTDIPIHPSADYVYDFQNLHTEETARGVDETMRIPLLALGFHDYLTETWVWRDTTFQNGSLAWKKDLFNILYGALPMWDMSRELWDNHKDEFLASYQKTHAVREKIGFAEMTGHGWLTDDKSVQYTDWSNGYRVIVNFGDEALEIEEGHLLPQRSFEIVGKKPGQSN